MAFVLDGKRFGGNAGRVRFSIDLSDVKRPEPTGRGNNVQNRRAKRAERLRAEGKIKEGERYFFVSLYTCVLSDDEGDAVRVVLGDDNLYGKNAEVTTQGAVKLTSLVSRSYKPSDQGVQTLDFYYNGKGDVLLVLSAVNGKGVGGGNRNFDNLSFRRIDWGNIKGRTSGTIRPIPRALVWMHESRNDFLRASVGKWWYNATIVPGGGLPAAGPLP